MKQYGMFVILGVFMTFFMGCSGSTLEKSASPARGGQPVPPEISAKIEAFGKAFETEYKTDPGAVIEKYINTDEVLRIIKSNPVYRNLSIKDSKYLEQKLSNPKIKEDLKKEFATNSAGVGLTYSGTVRTDRQDRAVFRLEDAKGNIDYWIISCSAERNEIVPRDLYIATSGGSYNDYIAGSMLDHFLASPGFVARLAGKTGDELKKKLDIAGRMGRALKSENFDQAISIYENEECDKYEYLPIDLLYLRALRAHDVNIPDTELKSQTEKVENAVATIKSYKPDFIGGELFLVERYIAMKDIEKGKSTLEQLRTKVGADAYLDFYEGRLYLLSNAEHAMDLYKSAGRKGLRSRAYLLAYYSLMKKTPGTSEAAMKKIVETGTSLYGSGFKQSIDSIKSSK